MRRFSLLRGVDSGVYTVLELVEGDLRITPYVVRQPAEAGLYFLGHATDEEADFELSLLGNAETPEGAVERLKTILSEQDG